MSVHDQVSLTAPTHPNPIANAQAQAPPTGAAASTAVKGEANDARTKTRKIRIGTRESPLAMVQTNMVCADLQKYHPDMDFEIVAISTNGDKNQVTPLSQFGTKALWTLELETLLLECHVDLVVNCLKDMPTQLPVGCIIGCITEREDPRDIVVMKKGLDHKSLKDLPNGAVVGTSSVRRSAQIKRLYPRLNFKNVRGNVGTRLKKLDAEDGEYSCLILAAAGILRMGWGDRITQYLDSKTEGGGTLYAVGQGALAIEVREGDEKTQIILRDLVNEDATLAGMAERSLMRTLEGGCSVPIGVESTWIDKGKLVMKAIVVSLDGTESVEAQRMDEILTVEDAEEFGQKLSQDLAEKGAAKILQEINLNSRVINHGGGA